jgi:hypothetical protein
LSKIPYAQTQPAFLTSLLIVAGALAVVALKRGPPPLLPPLGGQASRDEPLARQLVRAREPGREAASPAHIPWRGWKDIFWRNVRQVSQNRLLAISAAVVFYQTARDTTVGREKPLGTRGATMADTVGPAQTT